MYERNIFFSVVLKSLLSFSILFTQLLSNKNMCPNHISIYAHCVANWFQRASPHHHFPPDFFFPCKKRFIQSIITLNFEDLLQLGDIFKIPHHLWSLLRDSAICLDYSQPDLGIGYSMTNSQDYIQQYSMRKISCRMKQFYLIREHQH